MLQLQGTQHVALSLHVFFSFTAHGWWAAVVYLVKDWVEEQRVLSSRPSMDKTLAARGSAKGPAAGPHGVDPPTPTMDEAAK